MKKNILFLSTFFIMMSCGNSVLEKPNNLIDDGQMIDILTDLSIIDAMKSDNSMNGSSQFTASNYIFKKYKIDSLQFAQSNRYYASDVAKYKRMYKIVNERLISRKEEIDKEILKKTGKQVAPTINSTNISTDD